MRTEDIRIDATYTDGATAVRTVTKITSVSSDGREIRAVMCREHAGINRNRLYSMPLDTFADFARDEVSPGAIDSAAEALGLAAYPIDQRTREMIETTTDGRLRPSQPGDMTRLERLVGHGLARREGPRLHASSFLLKTEILAAAGRRARG